MCECEYTHTHLITSSSEEIMENYQGDLADIIRSGSGPVTGSSSAYSNDLPPVATTWQFSESDMNDFGHPLLLKPIIEETGAGIFSFSNNSINRDQDLFIKKPVDEMNDCAISICNDRMTSSNNCLMENSSRSLQISSPRNTGIKRRKGQAKKVVCIPAPTPANSRSTGEIVPSDLWAWRKYGQKPIKGSPYPRGYYRCSSLKGCSARKQVERSRTDPNMLVITYTSEHNHPWPTQRNALAGSTRNTQAGSKNNSTVNASKYLPSAASNPSPNLPNVKEEEKESINIDNVSSSVDVGEKNCLEEKLDIGMEENGDQFSEGFLIPDENYRPVLPDDQSITYNNPHDQDLFADLGEINEGADPLKLLFSQGFTGDYQISHSFCFYD